MQTQKKFLKGLFFAIILLAQNTLFSQTCIECDEEINFGGDLIRCENFENAGVGSSVADRLNWALASGTNVNPATIATTPSYQGVRSAKFEFGTQSVSMNYKFVSNTPDFDFHVATKMFVPSGKSARIALVDNNNTIKYLIDFGKNDTAFVKASNNAIPIASFRYPKDSWFRVSQLVRVATKRVEIFIGGHRETDIVMPNPTVAIPNNLNFNASKTDARFFIDNICSVRNKKVGFIANCPTATEAYCVGGVFNDLTNECLLGSDSGYIPLEFAKGNCNTTLGCVAACAPSSGCFNYYIGKDLNVYCENSFCENATQTYEWQILGDQTVFSFVNNTTKNSKNPNIKFSQTGTYTIIEKVLDSTGKLTNTCSLNVIYNPGACKEPPTLNIAYQTLGNGRFLMTTPNSQNISNLTWTILDINNQIAGSVVTTGANANPEFLKAKPGLVKVVATAINECGMSRSTYEVTDQTCQGGCPNVIDQVTNIKSNVNSKTLTFSGLPTATNYIYKWSVVGFPAISIPAVANPTINLPDFGTYTVCCDVTKTVANCVNKAAFCFSIKAEDDTQCFDQSCNEIRFSSTNNPAKPLEYTFTASNANVILDWRVKNLKTNIITKLSNTNFSITIDFADPKYGGPGDFTVAYKALLGANTKCCGISIKAENPFICGATAFNHTFNAASNNFVFTPTIAGGIFLADNGVGEPLPLPLGNILEVTTPCATRIIYYRYKNPTTNVVSLCAKKISNCPPNECNNIDISYISSKKSLILSVKNPAANSSNFAWTEDETQKNIGNTAKITYALPTASPCQKFTYSVNYFDGTQYAICSAPVSNCDPDACATSIQHSYSPNTGNGQLILTTNLQSISDVKWFIGDDIAQSINKNIAAGKYKISLLYFDQNDKIYKICSKSIKIGDDCFQTTDCDQLKFYFNNDPTTPLRYTFSAITTGTVTQWRIKNVKDNKTFVTNSGNIQTLDFSKYGGEGEYIICYEYENATSGDPSGCCCTKVCVSDPYACGENSISYEYNAALNSFVFTYNGQIAGGNGEWLQYIGGGAEPKIIPNGAFPIPTNCTTETIGFRYKDPISSCIKICYRTVYICNPFDCNNIDVTYKQSNNTFEFALKTTTGITKYNWKVEETQTVLSNTASASYSFANAICDTRNVAVRYFDGQKWSLCITPVFHCNPQDCAAFISENIVANKFATVSIAAQYSNVIWYINDIKSGTGNTFDVTKLTPGDYAISALFYDASAKYYRVCSKTITIGDECFIKSDCKDLTFFHLGDSKGSLKYVFTVADAKGLLNWQIKKAGDPNPTTIASTNGTLEIDFNKFSGEGEYTICASKVLGCCCIKLNVIDPTTCSDIDYKYNAATDNFDFTFKPVGNFTKVDWVDENGKITTPNYSVTPCATRTISYRYYDVAANIFRYCSRKVFVCNPFDCKNTLIDYKPSTKVFSLNLVNLPTNSNDFSWFLDENTNIGSTQSITYTTPNTPPCKKQTFSGKYFDGEKWVICATPIFVCNPDDCGDNISFTYSKGKLDFGTKTAFTDVRWFINDNKAKEKGNDIIPGTYKATVFYYDNIEKYYRVCSKSIVLDDECYQNPDCDNISFYQSGGQNEPLKFSFEAQNTVGITAWKFKKVGAANETVLTGTASIREIDFSKNGGAGEYIVCATNPNGCCCIKIKIEDPYACKSIDFQFDKNTKSYNLFTKITGQSKAQWLLETPGKTPSNVIANAIPLPANCVSRIISYRYFDDANKIWNYCSQNFYLCDPYICGDQNIFYAYENTTGKDDFKFILNDPQLPSYKDIAWQLDGVKPTALPLANDKSTNYYPPTGQDCKPYVISVKYYDSAQKTWRFCSINVNICNPEKCNTIDVSYKASVLQYEFSVASAPQSKGFTWTIEDLQTVIGDQPKTGYLLPAGFPCKNYTIGVRYFDGTSWRLCTKKVYLCDPSKCGSDINFTYDYDNAKGNGTLTLSSTIANITNIKWFIDDAPAQPVNQAVQSGNYSLSIVYTDAQGITHACSRKVNLAGGVDKFTLVGAKITAAPAQEAIVDIRSKNFLQLAQFQFTIQWNPAILKLKTEDKFLTKGTTIFDASQAASGFLGVKWDADNAIIGETYPDNAILYKIRFDVVGQINDVSAIDFVDKVLPIKITDKNGGNVPFAKDPGSVKIAFSATNDVEDASKYFTLYPNPTNQKTTLRFDPEVINVEAITLFDAQGKSVLRQANDTQNGLIELDVNDFTSGLYFLKINTKEKIFIDKLLIIK